MISTVNHVNIEDAGLSYRVYKLLNRAGFGTVGEVIKKTDKQLLEIRNFGVKSLEEIKMKIFDSERLTKKLDNDLHLDSLDTDCIFDVKDFSIRTKNALYRADIKTITELRKTPDYQLKRIRNLGIKSIAEIDAVVPDRIREYEGEAEKYTLEVKKRKADSGAQLVMRSMERDNDTLSDLVAGGFRYSGNKKARRVLKEYCDMFPERINEVLAFLETMNDTSDKLYKQLKASQRLKNW